MSQPEYLSYPILADARLADQRIERSTVGPELERSPNWEQAVALRPSGKEPSLSHLLKAVGTQPSLERLQQHLDQLPYPHYSPDPDQKGVFIRTLANGQQSRGKFVKRQFVEV